MSEEPTQEMREPTLREVLEAVNAIGVELHNLTAEVRTGFRNVERQIGVLSKDIVQLRADVGDLQDRLGRVEVKS